MQLLKRQTAGIISATILTLAAGWLFGVISTWAVAIFGAYKKEATAIITGELLRIYIPILLVSALVFLLLSLSKQKYIRFLYLLCGILSCVAALAVCGSSLSFYGVEPELRAYCEEGARSLPFAYGIVFPVLHTLLCILSCGERIKNIFINQVLTTGVFLMLFLLLGNITIRVSALGSASIAIVACVAMAVIIAPALNLDRIRQQLKKES